MIRVVPLRFGTAFKKAFSDPEVFSAFVKDVIGKEFHFDRIEQEKAFHPPVGAIDVRFDLYGEDDEHRAIVELQHVREADMFHRFNYYHLAAQIEQVRNSKSYTRNRTVYTIVVLTRLPEEEHLRFDVASQSNDLVTHDGRPLRLFHDQMVFLNPRAVKSTTPPAIRKWLEFIEDSLDSKMEESDYQSPIFRRILDTIVFDQVTPTELYWIKEEELWEDTKQVSFNDGLKEGLMRGILDMCDLLGITVEENRRAHLESLDIEALEQLRDRIKAEKRWSV